MTWDALAAVAGVVAAGAAAWQLWRLRLADLDARAAEVEGVSVVTVVEHRPWDSEVRDGRADWTYTYTVTNPGRLPISEVDVTIDYPCDVQRRNGAGLESPTRSLTFPVPVVAARSSHQARTRRLSVAREHWDELREAKITVSFWTPDAGRCSTTWPSPRTSNPHRALRKRLLSTQ